jgi:diguanylate cyclase (GGDEF)-like protein
MLDEEIYVLAVDDNPLNLQVLASIIEELGYECILAMSGEEAFKALTVDNPDLILLDIMMPGMDGYEVCETIKKDPKLIDIPVIFLTAKADGEDIIKGFSVGGADYVLKPFNSSELKMRIKTHVELKRSKDKLNLVNTELDNTNSDLLKALEAVKQKNEQLDDVLVELKLTSITDPLTGLSNRRHIMEELEKVVASYKRYKNVFSLIIADIDFFKKVNDTYGHDCGDYVLQQVSKIFKQCLRKQDTLSRWGGEEFLLLIPHTDANGAIKLAERMRLLIDKNILSYCGHDFSITVTFGVSSYIKDEKFDETIKRADSALYSGKESGRNCVVSL